MRDLVRDATGSTRGRCRASKGVRLGGGATRDLVREAIGSWLPLEFTETFRSLGVTGVYVLKVPLEVVTLSLTWPPLEVGAGYHIGDGFGNSTIGLGGFGTAVGGTIREDSTFLQFANMARTASIATSWELHRLVGTSLSAADKKCMECVILSSKVTVG